jgi:hypothetical protein
MRIMDRNDLLTYAQGPDLTASWPNKCQACDLIGDPVSRTWNERGRCVRCGVHPWKHQRDVARLRADKAEAVRGGLLRRAEAAEAEVKRLREAFDLVAREAWADAHDQREGTLHKMSLDDWPDRCLACDHVETIGVTWHLPAGECRRCGVHPWKHQRDRARQERDVAKDRRVFHRSCADVDDALTKARAGAEEAGARELELAEENIEERGKRDAAEADAGRLAYAGRALLRAKQAETIALMESALAAHDQRRVTMEGRDG